MARSLYKGERLGKLPPCLICMGAGRGERAQVHLPGGVSVWLCAEHRSAEFLARRAGRDFATSLMRAWQAAGCLTRRRADALDALRGRLGSSSSSRRRPGSYAWPDLRREAERRVVAGEPPARVIAELRARVAGGPARAPARRTMLRWLAERRGPDGGGEGPHGRRPPGPPPSGGGRRTCSSGCGRGRCTSSRPAATTMSSCATRT